MGSLIWIFCVLQVHVHTQTHTLGLGIIAVYYTHPSLYFYLTFVGIPCGGFWENTFGTFPSGQVCMWVCMCSRNPHMTPLLWILYLTIPAKPCSFFHPSFPLSWMFESSLFPACSAQMPPRQLRVPLSKHELLTLLLASYPQSVLPFGFPKWPFQPSGHHFGSSFLCLHGHSSLGSCPFLL